LYKTLIVAPPGRIRDGLQLLISSYPHINLLPPAPDGNTAVEMIRDHGPELIILDYNLSGWDESGAAGMGAETFIQRCKQQWPNIPCITLVDSPHQVRPAIEAGADTTLLKGFTIAQLLERIDRLLLQQRLLTGEQATI